MKRSECLIVLLSILRYSHGEWDGCYDFATSNPNAKLQRNKATQVCFATGPGGDWGLSVQYQRYSFQPTADEYSKFTVPGCKSNLFIINV